MISVMIKVIWVYYPQWARSSVLLAAVRSHLFLSYAIYTQYSLVDAE